MVIFMSPSEESPSIDDGIVWAIDSEVVPSIDVEVVTLVGVEVILSIGVAVLVSIVSEVPMSIDSEGQNRSRRNQCRKVPGKPTLDRCEPRNAEKRISLDEVSIVSKDRPPRPRVRTVSKLVTLPMGEDDPHRGHLAHGRGRPAPRSPRPWAGMTRIEVTSPMGEDDPHRGHLAHGRGPTSCPETVHPRLSSRNTILGPMDAITMSRLA
ncbi:hypothetical protein F2Q68_00016469 [Brassica cretica]|uniref:Uncharacterized protein n=1 Tax=Brassica cretica TaxID=69181 RepID=A0A8S9HIH0_BRACR|nr:hypothetical protein F2Q68_00016469 [Brassica cretica]